MAVKPRFVVFYFLVAHMQIFFDPFGFAKIAKPVASERAKPIAQRCQAHTRPSVESAVDHGRKHRLGTERQHRGRQERGQKKSPIAIFCEFEQVKGL